MTFLKKRISLIAFLLIFGFLLGCSDSTENKTYQNLEAKEAFEMIKDKRVLILDVRTPGEYAAGHIKDTVLIPVQILNTEYIKIMDHKKGPVFLYCRSGNRSVTASNILAGKGFKRLYNLKSGIKDWVKKGFPIEK